MADLQAQGRRAKRPSRKNGLQRPLSTQQVAVLLIYPVVTAGFLIIEAVALPAAKRTAVLALHGACVAVVCTAWAACSLLDPAKPGACFCPCMRVTQRVHGPKYCADCRKAVPGLDHHCVWLNTCVGQRTYGAFYTLAAAGAAQFAFQSAVGGLMLTGPGPGWRDELRGSWGDGAAARGALVAHGVLAAALALAFGCLLSFHTYLVVRGCRGGGIGTYDWLLHRAELRAKAAARPPRQAASRPGPARGAPPARRVQATPPAAPVAPAALPAQGGDSLVIPAHALECELELGQAGAGASVGAAGASVGAAGPGPGGVVPSASAGRAET
eukprot:g5797.t1